MEIMKFVRVPVACALLIGSSARAELPTIPLPAAPTAFIQGEWWSEQTASRIMVVGNNVTILEHDKGGFNWSNIPNGQQICVLGTPVPADNNAMAIYWRQDCHTSYGDNSLGSDIVELYESRQEGRRPFFALTIGGVRYWRPSEKDVFASDRLAK